MRILRLSILAACAVALPVVAHAANPVQGKNVYEEHCAVCHGADGEAVVPQTPNFVKGERMEKPDAQLMATMRDGLNVMPAWKGIISDSDMADALSYVRMLRK